MKTCDIFDATHVRTPDGELQRIVSKYGIDDRRLAKPSEGGFGCITESGARVSMWEAAGYYCDTDDEPAAVPERITVELSRQEYFAMISVLIDHRLRRDSTLEWVYVLNDSMVTLDDLIAAVTKAGRG